MTVLFRNACTVAALCGALTAAWAGMGADKLGNLDPATGKISEFHTGAGSAPRRMAAAPDGTLWVTLVGNGKLLHFDPATGTKIRAYESPAGPRGGP
jgi:streptogramin lyase